MRGVAPWIAVRAGLMLLACTAPFLHAQSRAPEWLQQEAQRNSPVPTAGEPYVILLDEKTTEIRPDGVFRIRSRYVIRVLHDDGRKAATYGAIYEKGGAEVKSLAAWTIQPDGKVTEFPRRAISDIALDRNTFMLFTERRARVVSAAGEVRQGSVFGVEAVVEDSGVFSQDLHLVANKAPVARWVRRYDVPEGWTVEHRILNGTDLAPRVHGRSFSWERTDIAKLPNEPMAPPFHDVSPMLAINIVPPSSVRSRFPKFAQWEEISEFFTPRYLKAMTLDGPAQSRVATVAGSSADVWDRIDRLATFVQEMNYVAVVLEWRHAGGFIPRPATEVLRTNYGDCKDKATLLCAMLAATGITAYPVLVSAGEANRVKTEWPAPVQFNHCIIAVAVGETIDASTVVQHPTLGRLLLFDPTVEHLPLGTLRDYGYSQHGLILAGARGGLIRMPEVALRPEDYRREAKLTLDPLGTVSGQIVDIYTGLAAAEIRTLHARQTPADFRRSMEKLLARTLPGAAVSQAVVEDSARRDSLKLVVDVSARSYGKMMRDQFLVFRPAALPRPGGAPAKKAERTLPVILRPAALSEITTWTLPAGFTVDESVPPIAIDSAYGRFSAQVIAEDQRVTLTRTYSNPRQEVPAAEFDALQAFYLQVHQHEQSLVVLRRL